MKIRTKTISKINHKWRAVGKRPKVYSNNTYKMLPIQEEIYRETIGSQHSIINAPTACGKSISICFNVAKDLSLNPTRKAIITVPQTIIGSGFKGYYNLSYSNSNGVYIENGENGCLELPWSPRHYLCDGDGLDSNTVQIGNFLKRDGQSGDINDRVLICSHAALINAFKKYKRYFKNINIVIDEAHHVHYSENGRANRVGVIVKYALKHEKKDIGLTLSTATLFRGDRLEVVPVSKLGLFKRYYCPLDRYLENCHDLKSFSYDFMMYENSYLDGLKGIFKGGIKKTIIYIPYVNNSRCSLGGKNEDVEAVYKSIAGIGGDKYKSRELDNGIIQIKCGNKWINVINLVDDSDESLREKRKRLIIEAHEHSDSSKIDVIVTLNMFREGANWKWANRGIIIGSKGSLTDMTQIVGRFLRDAPGKGSAKIIQMLPFSFDQLDTEGFRKDLNEYFKTLFASMLLEDAIAPIQLGLDVVKVKGKGKGEGNIDYLREQVGDSNKILQIWQEVRDKAITLQDDGVIDFGVNSVETKGSFLDIVSFALSNHGVKKFHKEISEQIRRRWVLESLKVSDTGMDLSKVDFDVIQINPLQFCLSYGSGACGLDTFKKFRQAIGTFVSLAVSHPEIAAEWHPTKNGKLTPWDVSYGSHKKMWWLCKNGHVTKSTVLNKTKSIHRHKEGYCFTCNSLGFKNPELAKEWHPTKNGKLTPWDVSYGSDQRFWWICKDCGHEWETSIDSKSRICPSCNSLAFKYPELVEQWHPTKNGKLTPHDVSYGSRKKVWWLCNVCGQEWEESVQVKIRSICPYCSRKRVYEGNCLATTHPKLAEYWHPTKNGKLTPWDVTRGSSKAKVWWLCNVCGQEWEAAPNALDKRKIPCPYCVGRRVYEGNCLATTDPKLVEQWHPTKNGKLTPHDVTRGSKIEVWWLCKNGHESYTSIAKKTTYNYCPSCNSLAFKYPKIAAQWHPTKNGKLTPWDVTCGSHKKMWWLCENGHESYTGINTRIRCDYCPSCNSLAFKYPKLAEYWHPTKNGKLTPHDVAYGSRKKVWWLFENGNERHSVISSRTRLFREHQKKLQRT